MPKTVRHQHDLLFKATLADPVRADSVLRAHLTPRFANLFTSKPPLPLPGSFVDTRLRSSQTDKLFQLELRSGQPAFAYVLLEHKSYSDPAIMLQLERYKNRIWEAFASIAGHSLRALPAIIPLVFYHGAEPWSAPGSLAEMIPDPHLRQLESSFGYLLRDLTRIPIAELAQDPAARAGLTALRYSHRGREAQAEKRRVLPQLLAGLPDEAEYTQQVMVYVMDVWSVSERTLRAAAERAKPGRGERLVGAFVQGLIDQGKAEGLLQGKAEGLLQGKAEGLLQGKAEGQASALVRLLEHRFGHLPEGLQDRIRAASAVELAEKFSSALDAKALSEIFGGNSEA